MLGYQNNFKGGVGGDTSHPTIDIDADTTIFFKPCFPTSFQFNSLLKICAQVQSGIIVAGYSAVAPSTKKWTLGKPVTGMFIVVNM